VLVKTLGYFVSGAIREYIIFRRTTRGVKADDFETIMHARDEEVVLAFDGWMPLDAPGSTSNIHICERYQGLPRVKKPNFVVITSNSNQMFYMRVALNRSYPSVEPFVDEEGLIKTLSLIPPLHLEIIPTRVNYGVMPIIPRRNPRFVFVGTPLV